MRVRACCLVSVHACVVSERASGRVRVCVMGAPVAVADAHQALAVAAMMCTMTRTCPALVIAFDLQVLIARACARGDGRCTCRNVRRSGSSASRLDESMTDSRPHSAPSPTRVPARNSRGGIVYGDRGALRHEFAGTRRATQSGSDIHIMRALSARPRAERAAAPASANATSARSELEDSPCCKLQK